MNTKQFQQAIEIQGLDPITGQSVFYIYGQPAHNKAKIIMYNYLTKSHWFSYDAGLNWIEIKRCGYNPEFHQYQIQRSKANEQTYYNYIAKLNYDTELLNFYFSITDVIFTPNRNVEKILNCTIQWLIDWWKNGTKNLPPISTRKALNILTRIKNEH